MSVWKQSDVREIIETTLHHWGRQRVFVKNAADKIEQQFKNSVLSYDQRPNETTVIALIEKAIDDHTIYVDEGWHEVWKHVAVMGDVSA